jgi:glycosyl hydrolase family 106( putative alpha-L-rhamnosidase)
MTGISSQKRIPSQLRSMAKATMLLFLLAAFATFPRVSRGQSATGSRADQSNKARSFDELKRLFRNPPDDSKIMMRWWWFGPAVAKSEIEREMRMMKEGGIGGFEVQPVYPLALDDDSARIRNLSFLSDEFIDALRFTSDKARELGLRFDLTLGSGWPYGGPTVSINEAASKLRVERAKIQPRASRVALPSISSGEKLLAVFLVRFKANSSEVERAQEITEIANGAARLPDGFDGRGEVQFFIASRTGMQVKRAAVGAEGYVLDHLNREAVDNYLSKVGDRLMQAFDRQPPAAIFCDSLEVYNSDWATDFLEEFQRRRGYDLKPHLAALVNDAGEKTQAVRRDWGKTLTELLNERFLARLRDWSKRHRILLRIQDYGAPAAAISSNAYADLSEGEGSQWKTLSAARWASSASRLYGQPVTSSETWTWLHSPSFRASPLDMKAEADRHFLQGINQLIGHGWPYTPEGVEYPGWRFYAAGAFNEKNPWWIVMPDLSLYLQRLSFLLRQGKPASDIAIYLPNDDAWAHFTNGNANLIDALRERLGPNLIPRLLEAGFNFDFFDDEAFKQMGRVEKGSLILGDNDYKVVILPNVEAIPLETFQKLEEFARGGGILLATRRMPDKAPGFQASDSDREKVADLSRSLFEGARPAARFIADETDQLKAALTRMIKPDAAFSPAAPEIGFIHRRAADAEIYFLANTDNAPRIAKAAFRVQGMQAEWWNPMTGDIQQAIIVERGANESSVTLELAPYESRVLVFTRQAENNRLASQASDTARRELDLSANWRVRFGDSAAVEMNSLRSWTDDERWRYYSGLVYYEKTFALPADFLREGVRIKLDFGAGKPIALSQSSQRANGMQALLETPVREAAVVMINGRRAGSVWSPPFNVDATKFLKSGENTLQIIVGNTAINHMAGRALSDYRLLNLRYGERFQPQDMDKVQPIASGLSGPIRLISNAR